jgi:hypothetical protein
MRYSDDTVDVRVSTEDFRSEMSRDAARHGSRAVNRRQNANIVARADAAFRTLKAKKGSSGRWGKKFSWTGVRADGIVSIEVADDQVVSMNVITLGDWMRGKTDDLIELTDRFALRDRSQRELVTGWNIGDCRESEVVEVLARLNLAECYRDVILGPELENTCHQISSGFAATRPRLRVV